MNRSQRIIEAWRNGEEPDKRDLLIEMSQGIKTICDNITNHEYTIKIHITLCLIFGDDLKYQENFEHWIAEITAAVPEIPYVKGTNKLPRYEQLKQRCLDGWSDHYVNVVDDYVINACDKEHITKIPEYNKDCIAECTISYYEWFLKTLSVRQSLNVTLVRQEVEKLMDEYRLSLQ